VSYLLELRKIVGQRPLFSPGACAIPINEHGQVLMQLRADSSNWGFPGGSMELGDSLLEAAQRELLEETGLEAARWKFVTMVSGREYFYTYPNGDQIYNVGAIYVARGLTGELRCDHESLELRWFDPTNLPTDLSGPITRFIVANFERIISGDFVPLETQTRV
jgi:8-oxo-dGTP pyrophosphatase MutT (NUDIX family)